MNLRILKSHLQAKVVLKAAARTKLRLLASSSLTPKNLKHIRATKAKTMKLTMMVLLLPHYVHDLKAK